MNEGIVKPQLNSAVIYARVPESLKEAIDSYALERGTTLTSAVSDLLERGLVSVSNEPSIAELESQVSALTIENSKLASELQIVRSELQPLVAISQRSQLEVGVCPATTCGKPITGFDLLVTGKCKACGGTLSGLLVEQSKSGGLNQQEFLMLIGFLGAAIGIALLASKG